MVLIADTTSDTYTTSLKKLPLSKIGIVSFLNALCMRKFIAFLLGMYCSLGPKEFVILKVIVSRSYTLWYILQ